MVVKRLMGFVALLALLVGVGSVAGAASTGVDEIGFVDQGALASDGAFVDANRSLQAYKAQLDQQFVARMRGVHGQAEQARVAAEFQAKLAAQQRTVLAPLFGRAQAAIASVASSDSLSVVLDKRIMIAGGHDVTPDVLRVMAGPGGVPPPASSPPPSTVGYVDQSAIDAIPQLRAANDEVARFEARAQQDARAKLTGAKTDADRRAVLARAQSSVEAEQKRVITPLVDKTRAAIQSVAQKRNLVLVVDRSNLIYGGTDITSDVSAALK